jgi:mono/diheme cytochrome c family protein
MTARPGGVARRLRLSGAMLAVLLAFSAGAARADGKGVFVSNCAVCHQSDGKGVAGVYPPLAGSAGRYVVLNDGRAYLIDVVSFGMSGKLEIAGDTVEGDMPPWPQLSNRDVAAVLDYVLTGLNAGVLPKNFAPITAAEVKTERAKALSTTQVHDERDALIKKLRAAE